MLIRLWKKSFLRRRFYELMALLDKNIMMSNDTLKIEYSGSKWRPKLLELLYKATVVIVGLKASFRSSCSLLAYQEIRLRLKNIDH